MFAILMIPAMLLSQTIAQSPSCIQGLTACQNAYSQSLSQSCNRQNTTESTIFDEVNRQECSCANLKIMDECVAKVTSCDDAAKKPILDGNKAIYSSICDLLPCQKEHLTCNDEFLRKPCINNPSLDCACSHYSGYSDCSNKITSCSENLKTSLRKATDSLKAQCEKAGKPLTGHANDVLVKSFSLLSFATIFIF